MNEANELSGSYSYIPKRIEMLKDKLNVLEEQLSEEFTKQTQDTQMVLFDSKASAIASVCGGSRPNREMGLRFLVFRYLLTQTDIETIASRCCSWVADSVDQEHVLLLWSAIDTAIRKQSLFINPETERLLELCGYLQWRKKCEIEMEERFRAALCVARTKDKGGDQGVGSL